MKLKGNYLMIILIINFRIQRFDIIWYVLHCSSHYNTKKIPKKTRENIKNGGKISYQKKRSYVDIVKHHIKMRLRKFARTVEMNEDNLLLMS